MSSPLKVVILGGGTSGWMSAAALVSVLNAASCVVRLIESDDIGTVGVGEATLPQIKEFNDYIGINEAEFVRKTEASFKLGIEFVNWGKVGTSYLHPFGAFGHPINGIEFVHYWTRARTEGWAEPIEAYSFAISTARAQRFDFPSEDQSSIRSTFSYAYHFDAGLYAKFLREFAEARGLVRTEGTVTAASQHAETGNITSVTLASGEVVEGDLFLDCSGFRAVLIEQSLKAGWEDWSHWLPCDRALAVPCECAGNFTPYTRSTALEAGWQWRIPLRHRTGNGYVFSSAFIEPDAASARLLHGLDGQALAEPRLLKFQAGRRKSSWVGNCLAIGLSSGFLEPLESTSIYLVQMAIINLLKLWPEQVVDPRLAAEFNRRIDMEYERVRDFLILHYYASERDDSELWRYVRAMSVPDSLLHKIEQFRRRGYIPKYKDGLFSPPSWVAVMLGQGIAPAGWDRVADNLGRETVQARMSDLATRIRANVEDLPFHDAFVRDFCFVAPAASHGERV